MRNLTTYERGRGPALGYRTDNIRDGFDETCSPLRVMCLLVGFLIVFPRPVSAFEMGILEQCERLDVVTAKFRADARRLFAAAGALDINISAENIALGDMECWKQYSGRAVAPLETPMAAGAASEVPKAGAFKAAVAAPIALRAPRVLKAPA